MPKKLTRAEKKCVREWLKLTDNVMAAKCPFISIKAATCGWFSTMYKTCYEWFPKIRARHNCPCDNYSHSYVIRRAKQMLKGT